MQRHGGATFWYVLGTINMARDKGRFQVSGRWCYISQAEPDHAIAAVLSSV